MTLRGLTAVYWFKIAATVVCWCVPLIFFPRELLISAGLPEPQITPFLRMLGWAYLALCVGYAFGLHAAIRGRILPGPIWVGVVSNGGAFGYLLTFGITGTWATWGALAQVLLWGSACATFLITSGLLVFGVPKMRS